MEKFIMITSNTGKYQIARDIFRKYNLELIQATIELPELQDYDVVKVSKYSAVFAANTLGKPVIKSDIGYYIDELGGFPGAYVKHINQMLKPDDILKMMEHKRNRKILLKECLTYAHPNGNVKQFVSEEEAHLSKFAMGRGTTFDKIIVLDGFDRPKGIYDYQTNVKHFKDNLTIYDEMAKYLIKE